MFMSPAAASSDPPTSPRRRPARLTHWLVMAAAGGVAGFLIGGYAARLTGPAAPGLLSLWDIGGIVLVWFAAILIHEGGHWLGGRIGGMRLLLMTAGPLRLTRQARGWRLGLFLRGGGFGGLTVMTPAAGRPIAPQLRPMILGGPLASLLLAGAALCLVGVTDGRVALYAGAIAALSAFLFVITALPLRIGGFLTDGAQWRELRRGSRSAELRMMLAALSAQTLSGTRPRDLDDAVLSRAHAIDDGSDPLCTPTLHFFRYVIAEDRGDTAAAGEALDRVGERIAGIPQGLRQAYAIELAYFEAAHRGDAVKARAWLEQARGGLVEISTRARAKAALALAEGRHDDARAAIERGEATLHRHYDRGGVLLLADQLRALRERLATSCMA